MAGTTPSSLAGTIATESIEAFMTQEPTAPRVYEAIANILTDCTGSSVQWVREVEGDTITSKAPNAEFTPSEYTTVLVNGVPATMGDSTEFADEIMAQGSSVTVISMLNRIAQRGETKINKDCLAAAAGSTNHSDFTGLDFTFERMIDATSLFQAQNPSQPRTALVLSAGQLAALVKSNANLVSGGAGGPFAASLLAAGLKSAAFITEYLGVEVWRSDVAIDGANASAILTSVAEAGSQVGNSWQPGSGLGLAFWWKARPGLDRIEKGTKSVLTVSSNYVAKIAVPRNVRRITALK